MDTELLTLSYLRFSLGRSQVRSRWICFARQDSCCCMFPVCSRFCLSSVVWSHLSVLVNGHIFPLDFPHSRTIQTRRERSGGGREAERNPPRRRCRFAARRLPAGWGGPSAVAESSSASRCALRRRRVLCVVTVSSALLVSEFTSFQVNRPRRALCRGCSSSCL
jgi:hypothetical protein